MFRITWMATACFALCAASADAQEFLGLPPEQYRQDPKTLEAKEQQLRAALAEPGFHVSDRNPQTWELIQTLTMAGKFQEAIAVWKPIVSRSREMGRYEGEVRESRDLFDLAELHFRAGEQEKAADIYRERIANYTEHFGAKSVHALFVREQLMTLYMRGKNYEKAIAEWETLRNDLPEGDPARHVFRRDLLDAYLATKDFERFDKLADGYLAEARKYPQGDTAMRVGLAKLYFVNGEVERSRKLLEQELVELRLKHGADSPEAIAKTEQLAQAGLSFGVQEFALEHYADVLKRLENKHGAGAEEPLKLRGKIASQWYDLKKLDKAQESYAELVPTMKTQLGAGHPLTLATTANWAMTLEDLGKFADAEPIRRTVAEDTAQAGKDPDSPEVLTARALVGANLLRQSKWTEAETILAAVLEARRKNEPMAWTTYNAASLLGEALLQQKKYQEAEPLLLEGYQGIQKNMRQIPPASYSRYYDAIRRLVTLYDQTDRNPEADKLRNSLPRGLRPSP